MSLLSKLIPLSAAGILMTAMSSAGAVDLGQVDMSNGKNIFENGKGDVPACVSCHGQNGEGNDSLGTPRLAGQIYQFLVKQLTDFGTCKNPEDTSTCRRQDTTMFVMNTNALGLTPQDRLDVAAYLSQLDAPYEPSNIDELKANGTEVGAGYRGKALVLYGNLDRGIPACRSCHGFNGRGVDPIFPMIGQQKYVYIINQLKKWRDGSRHNDPQMAMQMVARKMTDQDMHDAATYLAGPQGVANVSGEYGLPARHVPFKH